MSDPALPDPDAPIDAEFEPAPPKPKRRKAGGLPNIAALGLLGFCAVNLFLALWALGLVPGLSGADRGADEAKTAIELLAERQASASDALTTQTAALERAQTNLTDQNAKLAALEGRVDNLNAQLETLVTETASLTAALQDLTTDEDGSELTVASVNPIILDRLETLETSLAVLAEADGSEPAPDLTKDLAALTEDLSSLQEQFDTFQTQTGADAAIADAAEDERVAAQASFALSAIETAAARGEPFHSAYQQLALARPNNAAVSALGPIAVTGAPTLTDLSVQFPPLRRKALDLEAKSAGGSQGLLRSVFGDGVKVRRDGEVSAIDLLDDAEAALSQDNIAQTLSLLQQLSPDVQIVFTEWVEDAQRRESLNAALTALQDNLETTPRP